LPTTKEVQFPGIGEDTIVKVACGNNESAAITSSGTLYIWGDSFLDVLPFPSPVVDVACGTNHTLAITEDRSLYARGRNTSGELGLPSSFTKSKNFQKVHGVEAVSEIGCGCSYSLVLTKEGNLYSMGGNIEGSLGLGDSEQLPHYGLSLVMDNVISVATGAAHSLAMTKDGSLWTWGSNQQGQMGDDSVNWDKPKKLEGLPNFIHSFGCGWNFSFVVDFSGTVFVIGDVSDLEFSANFLPVPGLKVKTSMGWDRVFKWLFLGRLEEGSFFFTMPVEVIFHYVGLFSSA
jgi:hypothetical protein